VLPFLKRRFFLQLCETATLKTMTTFMSNCYCADSLAHSLASKFSSTCLQQWTQSDDTNDFFM